MYPAQPPPFSTSPAPSATSQPQDKSPSETLRPTEDDKANATSCPSLPSIHEAFDLLYPASASVPQSHPEHRALPSPLTGWSNAEDSPCARNRLSNGPFRASLTRDFGNSHEAQAQSNASRSCQTSVVTADSQSASPMLPSTGRLQGSKTSITSFGGTQRLPGPTDSTPSLAGTVNSANSYCRFAPRFPFISPPSNATFPPTICGNRLHMEPPRAEEFKEGSVGTIPGESHRDPINRDLDIHDVESSSNMIAERSTRIVNLSRDWSARASKAKRSGLLLGSLPAMGEVENILRMHRLNEDALIRIQAAVMSQQRALEEQMPQLQTLERGKDNQMSMYQKEFYQVGASAGLGRKKRRGKMAPSRCDRCNRTDTPEWRRGPNGGRTLCNACGLHYAKLIRRWAETRHRENQR